jgi:hypothetical protein
VRPGRDRPGASRATTRRSEHVHVHHDGGGALLARFRPPRRPRHRLFGTDNEHEAGFAAAIADRFWQAVDAGAIRCPDGIEVQLYVLRDDCLLVAVREREGGPPEARLRQVAGHALDAGAVACPFDETFEECREAIAHLLEEANGLLPALGALRDGEAGRDGEKG